MIDRSLRRATLFVILCALLAAACLGPVPELHPPRSGEASARIDVVGHGWHSGIVIRREDIPTEAWPESGRFAVVDIAPVAAEARAKNLQACGGCDVRLAKQIGAELAITGTVQKVSNLILNMNDHGFRVVAFNRTTAKVDGVAAPPFCDSTAVTIASLHRSVLEAAHEFHMPEAQFSVSKYQLMPASGTVAAMMAAAGRPR